MKISPIAIPLASTIFRCGGSGAGVSETTVELGIFGVVEAELRDDMPGVVGNPDGWAVLGSGNGFICSQGTFGGGDETGALVGAWHC